MIIKIQFNYEKPNKPCEEITRFIHVDNNSTYDEIWDDVLEELLRNYNFDYVRELHYEALANE